LKTERENPLYRVVRGRAIAQGQKREQAHRTAQDIVGRERIPRAPNGTYRGTDQGRTISRIVKRLYDDGLYDPGEDVADEVFGSTGE
jgi:hypothetical protein